MLNKLMPGLLLLNNRSGPTWVCLTYCCFRRTAVSPTWTLCYCVRKRSAQGHRPTLQHRSSYQWWPGSISRPLRMGNTENKMATRYVNEWLATHFARVSQHQWSIVTHQGRSTPICVSKLAHDLFKLWFVAWSPQSHDLKPIICC